MSGKSLGLLARLFVRTAPLALVGALALSAGACGDDFAQLVNCNTASDCPKPLGMIEVECCGGSCVAAAAGCDSGYRFLTSEPGVGDCAAQVQCSQRLDMAVPADLSKID